MTKSDFSGFWVEEERKGDAIVNIGNVWRKGLLLGILLLLVLIGSAQAENFTVRVEKEIIGFDENQITVETDQTGLLTLTLSDNYGTYRTITREAKRGATTFMWDGLGENEERLPSGSYTLHALLVTARGNQETQINVTVGKAKQALLSRSAAATRCIWTRTTGSAKPSRCVQARSSWTFTRRMT